MPYSSKEVATMLELCSTVREQTYNLIGMPTDKKWPIQRIAHDIIISCGALEAVLLAHTEEYQQAA